MDVCIVETGGTFAKVYDPISGKLGFEDAPAQEILEISRVTTKITYQQAVQLMDSLDMTEEDRIKILNCCRECNQEKIVVVHGTDTMIETAKLLGSNWLPKTIIFTGAMIPYSVAGSDAVFNLGFAVACAKTLPEGVYIAMNGTIFNWDNVKKNKIHGVF